MEMHSLQVSFTFLFPVIHVIYAMWRGASARSGLRKAIAESV